MNFGIFNAKAILKVQPYQEYVSQSCQMNSFTYYTYMLLNNVKVNLVILTLKNIKILSHRKYQLYP